MAHEIRFRAWFLPGEKFAPSRKMLYDIQRDSDGLSFDHYLYDGEHNGPYKDYPSRFIIMQNTGLKDSNDKEIWEGDLLKIWEPGNPHQYFAKLYDEMEITVGVVVYDEKEGRFAHDPHYGQAPPNDQCSEHYKYVIKGPHTAKIEVIGNIYENPELFTGGRK